MIPWDWWHQSSSDPGPRTIQVRMTRGRADVNIIIYKFILIYYAISWIQISRIIETSKSGHSGAALAPPVFSPLITRFDPRKTPFENSDEERRRPAKEANSEMRQIKDHPFSLNNFNYHWKKIKVYRWYRLRKRLNRPWVIAVSSWDGRHGSCEGSTRTSPSERRSISFLHFFSFFSLTIPIGRGAGRTNCKGFNSKV